MRGGKRLRVRFLLKVSNKTLIDRPGYSPMVIIQMRDFNLLLGSRAYRVEITRVAHGLDVGFEV